MMDWQRTVWITLCVAAVVHLALSGLAFIWIPAQDDGRNHPLSVRLTHAFQPGGVPLNGDLYYYYINVGAMNAILAAWFAFWFFYVWKKKTYGKYMSAGYGYNEFVCFPHFVADFLQYSMVYIWVAEHSIFIFFLMFIVFLAYWYFVYVVLNERDGRARATDGTRILRSMYWIPCVILVAIAALVITTLSLYENHSTLAGTILSIVIMWAAFIGIKTAVVVLIALSNSVRHAFGIGSESCKAYFWSMVWLMAQSVTFVTMTLIWYFA